MGKVALKLNGKPLDLTPKPPSAGTLKAFLDSAGADEVFTSDVAAQKAKVAGSSLYRARELLLGYSIVVGRNRYWGSKEAIAELRRQTA